MVVDCGNGDGKHEEECGKPDGALLKDVGGLNTEDGFGDVAAEGGTDAFLAGALHENDEDEEEGDEDEENDEEAEEEVHGVRG